MVGLSAKKGILVDPDHANPYGLTFYQQDCVAAVKAALEEHRSTLVVMPTGAGKSRVFSALAADGVGRDLVLAHRKELIDQARAHLERASGLFVDTEMAYQQAYSSRLVVGSVQSVSQRRRLLRLGCDAFERLFIDEAHRSACSSYKKIAGFFDKAKVVGFTATPDRGDGKALGQVFESVAYRMDIQDGIDWGYLCDFAEPERVFLEQIDLTGVRTTAGDLAVGQLDERVLKAVSGIVDKSLELVTSGQAIVFFPGVRSALLASERFNEAEPGCSEFVCGQTPGDERADIMRRFKAGEFRYLCNVGIATEGFDHPGVGTAILARPTKSRGLFTQMVGRATRPLTDTGIYAIHGRDTASCEARRALIAKSAKPTCRIVCFYGNAGHHSLCTPVDILAGRYTDDELMAAKALEMKAPKGEKVSETLERARRGLQEAVRIKAEVRARVAKLSRDSLFKAGGKSPDDVPGRDVELASKRQVKMLESFGISGAQRLSKRDASRRISALLKKRDNRAEISQMKLIAAHGVGVPVTTSKETAKSVISYIFEKKRAGTEPDPKELRRMLGR